VLGAAVLISHAGDLFTVGRQQRTRRNSDRATELRLNGLAQILHDMKAVSDLPRLRRALAIAADDLDVGMPLEPVRGHACGSFGK
jgi:hypothetical protein